MPHHGVVSLLDPASSRWVEQAWEALARDLGLNAVRACPLPHLSYLTGSWTDPAELDRRSEIVRRVAARLPPLDVRSSGLGVFTTPGPVVHLALVRDAALTALHAALWEACDREAPVPDACPLFRPAEWAPHVTLAAGDLDVVRLPAVVARFGREDLHRTIRIGGVGIVHQAGARYVLHSHHALGAPA